MTYDYQKTIDETVDTVSLDIEDIIGLVRADLAPRGLVEKKCLMLKKALVDRLQLIAYQAFMAGKEEK